MKRKTLKGQALLDYSLNHVQERLWDRYGLKIDKKEYRILCQKCNNNENLIFTEENCKNPSSLHKLWHRGELVLFVYERERGCITTVLLSRKKKGEYHEKV